MNTSPLNSNFSISIHIFLNLHTIAIHIPEDDGSANCRQNTHFLKTVTNRQTKAYIQYAVNIYTMYRNKKTQLLGNLAEANLKITLISCFVH